MAIIFEDNYHKITKTVNDFVNDTTEIEMNVYSSESARNLEKSIEQKRILFKSNVHNLLEQNMLNLMAKTSLIKPIEDIEDKDEFFKEHPEIEKEYLLVQSIQDEGLILADHITTVDVDINQLHHKDIWISLGLDEDLCKRVDLLGTRSVGVDGVRSTILSDLYSAVKEKVVGDIKDC